MDIVFPLLDGRVRARTSDLQTEVGRTGEARLQSGASGG